ncbi:VirE protein [Bacteroidia bacterium]|nr:VirE protein [Bacteroidia bacterium]
MNTNNDTLFSFYKAPIYNTKPLKAMTLLQIYHILKSDEYKYCTEQLRQINVAQPELARQYKAYSFDYCTFSGVFTSRKDSDLVKHSGLLCLDFDHLNNLNSLKMALIEDEQFETQLLFTSPSGDGLKWLIAIDPEAFKHEEYFQALCLYTKRKYANEPDKSGKDISRACFIPSDPNAYINPNIQ